MNQSDSEILSLVAAMTRAKESGNTDEEARQINDGIALGREIWDASERFHVSSGGSLDTHTCLRAVALTLGLLIKAHRVGEDQLAGLIVATEMCELILGTSTEK